MVWPKSKRCRLRGNVFLLGERVESRLLMTRLIDMEQDGDLDAYDGLNWYENTDGQGNLLAHPFANGPNAKVQVADLDGDGDFDFVTGEPKWYENVDGQGRSFTARDFPGAERSGTGLRVEDVGGDGDRDVILWEADRVEWFENRGRGQAFVRHSVSMANVAHRVTDVADFDLDGDLDLTLYRMRSNAVLDASFLATNNGQDQFTLRTIFATEPTDPEGSTGFARFVDIDGDGLQDIVGSAGRETTFYHWFQQHPLNRGSLLSPQLIISTGYFSEPRWLIDFLDWDQDGDLDAAGVTERGSGYLWRNNAGTFAYHSTSPALDILDDATLTDAGDLNRDGAVDWMTSSFRNGVPLWFDGKTGAAHQNRLPNELQPGDANRDLHFDEADLIAVAKAGRWQLSANWASGDWNGGPGGSAVSPPVGDRLFNAQDLATARAVDLYRKGPYASTETLPDNEREAMKLSLGTTDLTVTYDATTGRLSLQSGHRLTALQLHSRSGLLTSPFPANPGPFDVATSHDIFRFDFQEFNANILTVQLPAQLSWEQVHEDLQIDGARATGGDIGNVRFTCTSCGLDVDSVRKAVAAGTHARWSDVNGDARTNVDDLVSLLSEHLQSSIGDANLDGQFDARDLVRVFQRGQFEDTISDNATWADGDWNGDSDFDSSDFVIAFQKGLYGDAANVARTIISGEETFVHQTLYETCRCRQDLSGQSMADLDGDGDLDLLASSYFEDSVYWQENLDGLGTFGAARTITSQLLGVATAIASDVDGDGDMDVMASSINFFESVGDILWFENVGGSAVFDSTPHSVSNPSGASKLATGDLDQDGDADLVLVSTISGAVDTYTNDGKGNFTNHTSLEVRPGNQTLTVVDSDGDGDLDIFTAYNQDFRWFENDGKGKFVGLPLVNTPPSQAFTVGDVDGDRRVEVFSVGRDSAVTLFRPRQGTYYATTLDTGVTTTINVTLGDLDRDGDQDLILGNWQADGVRLENTDGEGTFGNPQTFASLAYPKNLRLADVDEDGDLDLTDGSRWLENANGSLRPGEWIRHVSSNSQTMDVADFDGDQDLDVVAGYVLANRNSSHSYTFTPIKSPNDSLASYLYDLDQDGDLDLISNSPYESDLYWSENENGEGFFGEPRPIRIRTTTAEQTYEIAFDDVDLDGDTDIVAGLSNRLIWFENMNGRGRFERNRENVIDGTGTKVASMADMDMDGLNDLLTAGAWFRKLKSGGFGPRQPYRNASPLEAIIPHDLDLDGDLDLLATTLSDTYVIENLAGGQLSARTRIRGNSSALDAADLDRDGDVDVVFGDWSEGLGWLERVGDRFVFEAHPLLQGESIYAVEAIDHDGDGDVDIVSATTGGIVLTENQRLRRV